MSDSPPDRQTAVSGGKKVEDGNVWAAVGDGVGGGGGEDSENRLKIESLKTLGGVCLLRSPSSKDDQQLRVVFGTRLTEIS